MYRGDMRTQLRRRLGDTMPEQLYRDDALDAAIAEAIRRYSTELPRLAVWEPVVAVGTWEIPVPDHIDPLKVTRLADDKGLYWDAWHPCHADMVPPPVSYGDASAGFMWRVWARTILLSMPAQQTGIWRIEYALSRSTPDDDACELDIDRGDEDAVLAQAMAIALHRAAMATRKLGRRRSARDPLVTAVRSAQLDADRLLEMRIRDRHGGTVLV